MGVNLSLVQFINIIVDNKNANYYERVIFLRQLSYYAVMLQLKNTTLKEIKTMRKIMILITILVMAFSAMPVYAESYTVGIEHSACSDDICGLMGDSVNQVNRTCKKCHTRTVTVYCTESTYSIGNAPCAVASHTTPCETIDRLASVADAYCAYCGSYYYDAGEFRVWDFEGHVESCRHFSTGEIRYYTCLYGPRA